MMLFKMRRTKGTGVFYRILRANGAPIGRVLVVFVNANWFDPVLVPVSRRTRPRESSPLDGEIVRLFGHNARDAKPTSRLGREA